MLKTLALAAILLIFLPAVQATSLPSHLLPNLLAVSAPLAVGLLANNSPNFTVTVYPLSQSVRIGEQATFRIALNSTGGFIGNVTLQTENFPQELLKAFSPTIVSLKANTVANSTLTINTISVGEEAFYEFKVVATSGGITKRVTVQLTVLAENSPPSILSYAFLAGVLLFSAIIVWYGLRSRRLQSQGEEISEEPKPPPV